MFSIDTTLKHLILFVLPNPKFTVPISEVDPVYRAQPQTANHDVSGVSQNPIDFASFNTPVKARPNAGDRRAESSNNKECYRDRARCRNTSCCGAGLLSNTEMSPLSDDFKPGVSLYAHPCDPSNYSSIDSETSNLDRSVLQSNILNSSPGLSRNSDSKIRVVTPVESPTPSSMRRRFTQNIAALYSPDSIQDNRAVHQTRFNGQRETPYRPSKKSKEKRNSAPSILAVASARSNGDHRTSSIGLNDNLVDISRVTSSTATIYAIPHSHLITSPPSLLPVVTTNNFDQRNDNDNKNQWTRPHSNSSSSLYANKLFELDLSPIIEDMCVFGEYGLTGAATRATTPPNEVSGEDSSGSSYGELLEERTIDFSSFGGFGRLDWSNAESRVNEVVVGGQYETQNFGEEAQQEDDGHEKEVNNMHVLDGSVMLFPKLISTVPKPEQGYSTELTPRSFVNDGSDHQFDNIMLAAEMAALGAPNELGTGTDLVVGRLGKRHGRRSFLGKQLDSVLNGRFGLSPKSGVVAALGGDASGASGKEAEMSASGNGFRWLASRRRMNETVTKAGTKAESTGCVWTKRLSRILEDVTGPSSSGRTTGVSGPELAHGSPTTEKMVITTTARPLSSSRDHLRSGRGLSENHSSGSSLLETTTRVDEEGEHAASRLSWTHNTGTRVKNSPRNWYRSGASGERSRFDKAKRAEPRRHSFGFGFKSLRFSRRSYAMEDVGVDVACEIGRETSSRGVGWKGWMTECRFLR